MSVEHKKILVTGASGYLASWIVNLFLQRGHAVNATVRSLDNRDKIEHLLNMKQQFPQRLCLFEADLMSPGSFDEAMVGCEVVIHTASPYFLDRPNNVNKDLLEPAVKGTLNVLNSVEKNKTVKRVVLTSSIAALYSDAKQVAAKTVPVVDETDVNNGSNDSYNPYAYSKTVAEKTAWEFSQKQNHWQLVTVHPGAIFGPALSKRTDATSVNMVIQFVNGSFKSGVPNLKLGVVDVRDAAEVHLKAAVTENVQGKYIAVNKSMSLLEISKTFNTEKFGLTGFLPKGEVPKFIIWIMAPFIGMQRKFVANNVNYDIEFDNQRSISELNIDYRKVVDTFNDHVAQLVNDGLV